MGCFPSKPNSGAGQRLDGSSATDQPAGQSQMIDRDAMREAAEKRLKQKEGTGVLARKLKEQNAIGPGRAHNPTISGNSENTMRLMSSFLCAMSYATIEPTVIDEELIRKAINEQLNPEIAETARKEGVDSEEVTSLRLDYKNILKIDNLWIYERITTLQLDNNIIEKIENINFLKNLKWLDLSFNNITVIEGLDGLTQLTDLTLFNNRISELGGMGDLVNLQVFSIGNNNITSFESVLHANKLEYLNRFDYLRVLNVSGNAICKVPEYRDYCLSHFKKLKYLDYRLIDEDSFKAAREKFIDSVIALEEEEKLTMAKKAQAIKEAEINKIHEKAHILRIDSLFDRMFDENEDFNKLVPIAPAILNDLKEELRVKVDIIIKELKHFVLQKSTEKEEEKSQIARCIKTVREAKDAECLVKLNDFYHAKKKILKTINNSRNPKEIDEAVAVLRFSADKVADMLMGAEMELSEQFEDILKDFERNYTELCQGVTEFGSSSFARLREIQAEFLEKFTEAIISMYDRFNKGDIEDVDDDIRDIMNDKDTLMNTVTSSHDFCMAKLDQQEDVLISGVAKDLDIVLKQSQKNEIKRNRDRVGEIIAFTEKNQADIDHAEENSY